MLLRPRHLLVDQVSLNDMHYSCSLYAHWTITIDTSLGSLSAQMKHVYPNDWPVIDTHDFNIHTYMTVIVLCMRVSVKDKNYCRRKCAEQWNITTYPPKVITTIPLPPLKSGPQRVVGVVMGTSVCTVIDIVVVIYCDGRSNRYSYTYLKNECTKRQYKYWTYPLYYIFIHITLA